MEPYGNEKFKTLLLQRVSELLFQTCLEFYVNSPRKVICGILTIEILTRKTTETAENRARQQTTLICDILINITVLQAYVQCTDLLLMKIWVTLTLTFPCHSRSNLPVPLNSPYMVSY